MGYSVELRIEGQDLNPVQITIELDLQPNHTRSVGWRQLKDGTDSPALWSYDGLTHIEGEMHEWSTLEEGILFVSQHVISKVNLLKAYQEKWSVYWWCGQFLTQSEGHILLSSPVLSELAQLNLALYIETYWIEAY